MVLQNAINKAKEQQPEEKKVIAGGVAAAVVLILVVVWGFFFLRKMRQGVQVVDLTAGAQNEFNFTSVREAQRAIQESFQYTEEELEMVRESAVERQLPQDVQGFEQAEDSRAPTDQFGSYLD